MDLLSVISDKTNYQIIYKHGLEAMLKQTDELGVFILVLANSTYDSALFEEFKPSLEQRFGEIEKQFLATNDHSALGAPDDVAVFEQLMDIGFDSLEVNQKKYLN
ncbi:MAG: hypothetical protein ISR69_02000, partial [Gammaproteobacteria bacterium]|nr:hypothetical protein [Gammaproteobacteria bacterium]